MVVDGENASFVDKSGMTRKSGGIRLGVSYFESKHFIRSHVTRTFDLVVLFFFGHSAYYNTSSRSEVTFKVRTHM